MLNHNTLFFLGFLLLSLIMLRRSLLTMIRILYNVTGNSKCICALKITRKKTTFNTNNFYFRLQPFLFYRLFNIHLLQGMRFDFISESMG